MFLQKRAIEETEEEPSTSQKNKADIYRQNRESSSTYGIIETVVLM